MLSIRSRVESTCSRLNFESRACALDEKLAPIAEEPRALGRAHWCQKLQVRGTTMEPATVDDFPPTSGAVTSCLVQSIGLAISAAMGPAEEEAIRRVRFKGRGTEACGSVSEDRAGAPHGACSMRHGVQSMRFRSASASRAVALDPVSLNALASASGRAHLLSNRFRVESRRSRHVLEARAQPAISGEAQRKRFHIEAAAGNDLRTDVC